jgi:hypothetical protein
MGVPTEDFIWTVEDVAEEIREPSRSFKDMQVTVDRVGAYMAINQNSREPVTEPDELAPLWKILHLVGADWTYPSVMWAGENYCLFLADEEGWRYIMEEFVDHIDNNLGCKHGGQHRVRALLLCDPGRIAQVQHPPQVRIHQHHQLYAQWIREGKAQGQLRLEQGPQASSYGPGPLQHRQETLREEMADELRFVVKTVVGEENFVDMVPCGVNNYCCGGGGGALAGRLYRRAAGLRQSQIRPGDGHRGANM